MGIAVLAAALAGVLPAESATAGADAARASAAARVLPHGQPIYVIGKTLRRRKDGRRVGHAFKRFDGLGLRRVRIRVRCLRGCPRRGPATRRFVRPREMRGEWILNRAVLALKVRRRGWIGLYVQLRRAGLVRPKQTVRCLFPGARRPRRCPRAEGVSRGFPLPGPAPAAVLPAPAAAPAPAPAPDDPPPSDDGPPPDRDAIASYDGTNGDRAPYSGGFNFAYQPFVAASDTVTYLGATVGNPNLPVGESTSDRLPMRLCESASCAGTELANAEPFVNNYGLTTADIGDVAVTPGEAYYLRWDPPEDSHGTPWLSFWHAGQPTIEGSERMEAIVRGYEQAGAGPSPARRAVIHYGGSKSPPAPYSGAFVFGLQPFEARSDTITELGVVLGNPNRPRGAEGPQAVTLRLCTSADCSSGILATRTEEIVNYDVTSVDIGDVHVTPGQEHFIYWQAPTKVEGASWISFWHGSGPLIEDSVRLQAYARGYNRSGKAATPVTFPEQAGPFGVPTFANPFNASGQGPGIGAGAVVDVSCRLFAPQIQSVEPDGYWYRIHSLPWNDGYYAAANSFLNGGGGGGEAADTDFDVPDCAPVS